MPSIVAFLVRMVMIVVFIATIKAMHAQTDGERVANQEDANMNNSKTNVPNGQEIQHKQYKIACYYDTRLISQSLGYKLRPHRINASLCSHLMFGFANIKENGQVILIYSNRTIPSEAERIVERTMNLKDVNKELKILLSVGGWNFNSDALQKIVTNNLQRNMFINSTLSLLKKYKFDGLDIYAENPENRGDIIFLESKSYLVPLVRELRTALKPHNYLLTAALPGNIISMPGPISPIQVMNEIAESLDFLSIMAYDLHGAWENVTVHHSPLFMRTNDKEKGLSIDMVTKEWLKTEIPRDKMLLGLASYGRSFVIKDNLDRCPQVGTPILCAAPTEEDSVKSGLISLSEICLHDRLDDWVYNWLEYEKVPFLYSREYLMKKWVGFDDVRSFEAKTKYLIEAGLGGAMLFSLDNEDYFDDCSQNPFPLLRVLNYHLNKNVKIDYPNPDEIFNITRKKFWDDRRDEFARNALMHLDITADNHFELYNFCTCKSGLQIVNPGNVSSNSSLLIVDCDKKQFVNSSQIKQVGLQAIKSEDSKMTENHFTIDEKVFKRFSHFKAAPINVLMNESTRLIFAFDFYSVILAFMFPIFGRNSYFF